MIMVDTNVLLDIYKADTIWMPWSLRQLRNVKAGHLGGNMVAYAELAGHPGVPAQLNAFLNILDIRLAEMSRLAARLACQAFRQSRGLGGTKNGVLPNFFIGAHAKTEGYRLLTRDAGRYRSYFPDGDLICP